MKDSIPEKTDSFSFNQGDKTLPINSSGIKANVFPNLPDLLKQQITEGSMDVQPLYKTDRPYFPATSLHMKLNSRYISKVTHNIKIGNLLFFLTQRMS